MKQGPFALKETGSPEDAVALTVKSGSPSVRFAIDGKSMV
jgi:hypothetical protein